MSIADEVAVDKLRTWRQHPAAMVEDLFGAKPDPWQFTVLEESPHKPLISLQAAKGPGKTTLLAWLGWNKLITSICKGAATSIDWPNLSSNLWAELALWQSKSPLLQKAFTWTKTRISSKEHPEFWFLDARTWPKDADKQRQADTLAGLHADYVFFLIDESGSIPVSVLVAAEAALSSCKEGHIIQAGNCTSTDGMLYAAHRDRKRWYVVEITGDPDDPNRAPRISVEWARDQIRAYGRESPWVMVNVLGKYPPTALNALISLDEVEASMQRSYREFDIGAAPKILGVDVARFGDDQSIIYLRQGLQCFEPKRYRNVDSTQGGGQVNRIWSEFDADACFIDATGGFGSGWEDHLRLLGRAPIGIHFSSSAHNDARYANKRTEMYFDLVEWVKRGGALHPSREMKEALTQTTYTFQRDRLILEPKDMIKVKLGYSPDEADAAALTFAEPVAVRQALQNFSRRPASAVSGAYDPFGS
jgi:hypothetical protein